jgi:hypothetical protein
MQTMTMFTTEERFRAFVKNNQTALRETFAAELQFLAVPGFLQILERRCSTITAYLGRDISPSVHEETYSGGGDDTIVLRHWPVLDILELRQGNRVWEPLEDFVYYPEEGVIFAVKPGEDFSDLSPVEVKYRAGIEPWPDEGLEAALFEWMLQGGEYLPDSLIELLEKYKNWKPSSETRQRAIRRAHETLPIDMKRNAVSWEKVVKPSPPVRMFVAQELWAFDDCGNAHHVHHFSACLPSLTLGEIQPQITCWCGKTFIPKEETALFILDDPLPLPPMSFCEGCRQLHEGQERPRHG